MLGNFWREGEIPFDLPVILQHSYEIKNSMKNRRRLQELRKIAFKRIFGKERR